MKGTGNFVKEFFGGLFVLLCFAFGLTACEVGLGGAIDTSDPRAGVTSPSIDGVVGGSVIHLEGSCEDDTGVAEVRIVRLYEKDGLVDYSNLGNATLSADGRSWTLDFTQSPTSESLYIFNGQELYLPDGTYHINVLPVDVGGRIPKNDAGRSFKIDNTPPIFLITSPSSKNIEDPSPYGKTIKVKGNIYDTSDGMSDVTVSIYNTSGTQIDIQKTSDMTTGLGTKDKEPFEVLIARQNAQDDAIASSNYTALYPPSNGNNKYYMEIKLKDMANSDNDLPGNEASIVYFRAPLFEKLKRELGVSSLSGSDLMRGYNGTHSSFTSEQCNKIKRILDGTYDDDTSYYAKVSNSNSTRLAFSVDPNNTPKYSFGGMTYESGTSPTEWSGRGAAGGSISISVMAGSDEYLVDPSTLKVYIQAVTESGSNIGSRREVTVRKEDGSELGSTGTDSATYIVTLPDDLSDTYYKLSASGKGYSINETTGVRTDIDMVPAKNPGGYGFVLFSNKIPVTITSEADQSYVRKVDSNKYSFAIKISDPNNPTSINRSTGKIKYQIKAEQGYKTKQEFTSASWNGVQINSIEGSTLEGPVSGLFSKTISNLDFTVNDDSVGTIALRIWGDNGVESDKNVYLLYVDNKKPTITVNNNSELTGSALITERSSNYVAADGEYRLSGTWRDEDGSGVKILKYSTDGNTWTDIGTEYTSRITDVQSWSVQIPVEEGAGKQLHIKAIDLVGNEYVKPYENIKFDFSDPEFTTVPTITKDDYVTSNRTFTAVAVDSFGLSNITVVAKLNGNQVTTGHYGYSLDVANTNPGSDKSKTATIVMGPTDNSDGEWEIELTATDLNGRTTPAKFGFMFDHTAPVINDGTTIGDGAYSVTAWQKDRSARISGTIDEAIALKSLYYLVKKSDETLLTGTPADITGMAGVQSVAFTNKKGTVPFSITVDGLANNESHGNVVYIQAEDDAGNKGEVKSFVINVDQLAPSLAALKYKIGSGTASEATGTVAVNTQTLTLWGTYTDACSGVNALGFEIGSEPKTPTSIEYTTENVTASNIDSLADSAWTDEYNAANAKTIKGWKATFESNKFANGTIKVSGTDVAGNSTTVSSITLRKDNVKPTVSNVSIEGAYRKTDTVYYVNNSTTQIKVKGVSADDYALNSTVVTIPGLASSPITLTGTSWTTDSLNIAGLTGSSVTVSVVSHDSAGNESVATNITLNFDKVAPSRVKNVIERSTNEHPTELDWGGPDNWKDTRFRVGSKSDDDIKPNWYEKGGNYNAESYSGSTSLLIRGQFTEEGSGIKAVYYEVVNGNAAPTLVVGSNYDSFSSIVPASDGTFSTTITGLKEGSNKLRIIAIDNVGNVSKITNLTDKYESDFVLGLDQTAPTFGNSVTLDGDSTDNEKYVTGNASFTITGTLSDDKAGLDSSTLKFWFENKNYDEDNPANGPKTFEITTTAGTYGQVTYSSNDASNKEASFSIEVTPGSWFKEDNLGSSPILYGSVADQSNPANSKGQETILTRLRLDTKSPVIKIDEDVRNQLDRSLLTEEKIDTSGRVKEVDGNYFYELTGTWSDVNGSGTDKLYYSINNGTTWIDVDTLTTKNYAKSKTESSWSLYIPVEEGTSYNFAVKAEDAVGNADEGNAEARPNKTVTFDFSKPTIEISLADGVYGETRPTVTITAHDHHRIKTTDGIVLVGTPKKNGANASASDYTLETTTGGGTSTATRTLTFNTDGVYEFTFKAIDVNNRESDSISRTWTVDTEAPSPKADNDATYGLKVNGAVAKTWYRDTNLRFDGYVEEAVSGLKTVYYLVDTNSTAAVADVVAGSQWNFAGSTNTGNVPYSVTPTVGSGTSYVHMVFEDEAGNRSDVKTSTVMLDQDVPTISGKYYNFSGVTADMPSSLFVNTTKSETLTLYGLVNETGSGIDTLTLTKSGDTFSPTITYATGLTGSSAANEFTGATWSGTKTGATAWKATFNVNGLSTGPIQAAVNDLAGNGSTVQLVSLDSDATAPTLTLTNSDLQTAPYGISERSPYMTVEDGHHNYTFQGSWSDAGSGTYALYYSTNSSTIGSGTWNPVDSTSAPQSTGTTNWTLTLDLAEGTGKQIAFYAEDKVGNKSPVISKTGITVDYTDPTLTLTPATAESYYPLEASNTAIWTITASDNLGTPAITVVAKKDGSEVSSGTNGYTYNASSKTITLANNANANGTWNITVTATDGAGRTTVRTLNTIVDRSIPVINDDIEIHDGDVVKNYDVNSWSRNGTLTVKGTINEAGSGLSIVYFMKGVANGVTNLKEITSEDRKSVGVLGIGSSVEYEFTVSDLAAGSTVVGIQTEDKAGNLSDIKRITLNLDKTNPSFGKTNDRYYSYEEALNYNQIEGTVLSNGTKDLDIVGPYSDTGSGVAELAFEIVREDSIIPVSAAVEYSTDTIASGATNIGSMTWKSYNQISDKTAIKSYRAKIGKDDFENGDGIVAKPLDRAGNGSTQTIFTIAIDNTAPVLTLNTPKTQRLAPTADAEAVNTVNGTVAFAGTTEETAMNRLELYWGTAQNACNTLIDTKAASQSYNWSFNVPFSTVQNGTAVKFMDGSSYTGSPKAFFLKLLAVDKAGNEAEYIYKYNVDPDGDRPIITFTQLDLTGLTENANTSNVWLTDSKTLSGSVTDDDGVAKLEYKLDSGTWQTLPVTNGNFSYTFATDKKYSMSFRVTDTAGNVAQTPYSFATATSGTQYLSPRFMDKNSYESNCSILNFAVDSNSPEISNVKYIANDGSDAAASDDFTQKHFGGKWKKFKIRFDAQDTNGIETATVTFNGNVEATTKSSNTYTTGYIQLGDLPTGNYNALITVKDNAGREQTKTVSFVVDNDAPTVRIQQPTGLVSTAIHAQGSLGEVYGMDKVYFMVTEHDVDPTTISTIATSGQNAANRWKEYENDNDAISTFDIVFDDKDEDNHTNQFKWYLSSLGLTTTEAITNGSFTALTTVDLHIKAIDAYGNTGYATKTVTVDPQGDKPTVTITYPVADSTLGGTIPIMGTAIDNAGSEEGKVGADYVMVLIDMDGDGDYDRDDITALGTMSPVPSWLTWGKFESKTWTDISYASIPASGTDWTKYGIKKEVSNASWSFTVNQGGELNPAEGTKNLGLWVYATDGDGNTSQIDLTDNDKTPYVKFKIDKDTPQIANEYLVQYDNGGNVTAKYAYSKDMSIKGVWYYEADMYDDSGISKVTRYKLVDGTAVGDPLEMTSASTSYDSGNITLTSVTTVTVGGVNYTNTVTPGAPVGFHIKMKVGSGTANEVVYQDWKLSYEENAGQALTGEREVALNVDNKAPVVIKTGDYYNIRDRVTNENGFYTFGTQAKEDAVAGVSQTGVKRVAFYFTRDIDSPSIHSLYDVMKAPGDDGNAIDGYTSLTKEEGLYWKTLTGSASGKAFNLSSADPNVHTGGLVKINGVIYRIESVSGTRVSVEVNTTAAEPFAGVTSAKFAMANVVDNPTEETADETSSKVAGYYTNVNFDDGDIMVESLKKQSSTWTWEANINSKNIGDGSAKLHYVVFDAAGNYAEEEVNVFVANNQPRIAGVSIGTDTNGNGTVDAAEMISEGYSGIYAKGKQGNKNVTEAWFPSDKSSSVLKILGNTKIKPEIVGGNGQLDYSYKVYESNGNGSWNTVLASGGGTGIGTGNGDDRNPDAEPDAQILEVNLTMAELLGMGNKMGSDFALTIADQTPGGALTATLNIIVDSLLQDNNPPKSRIIPFYWVSGTKNSLFMESKDYGHIELPIDLPNTFTAGGTGVNDRDPKLSGIVKIEGVAQDDVLLKQLKVNVGGTEYTIGTYNGDWTYTNGWDGSAIPTNSWKSLVTNATYREAYDMGFIPQADFDALDEVLKDTPVPYITAKYGHIVHWTLYIDSSIIGNGTDKAIRTSANDRGMAAAGAGDTVTYTPNSWTEANDAGVTANVSDSGTPTGYQKVDVVPYISKVYTNLAKNKVNNWSVYNRTALGHYPVQSVVSNIATTGNYKIDLKTKTSETVTLYGFNINDSSVRIQSGTNNFTGSATGNLKIDYSTRGQLSFNVAQLASGPLNLTVNGFEVMNNINNNDAKGSATEEGTAYANWYNRQGNGDTNNILTDDIWFDVWEFNDRASTPINGLMTGINMEINQKTKMLNYAFANGGLYYSMGGNTGKTTAYDSTNSYSSIYWAGDWDTFAGPSVGFHVDDLGWTYSLDSGGDTNSSGSVDKWAFYTSRWNRGSLGTEGTLGGGNSLRLEEIGLKTGSGTYDYSLMKYRFLSAEFASTVSGNNTNLYLVYYDALTNQIRFRAGTFNGTTKQSVGGFQDEYTNGASSYYSTNNCQVIANGEAEPFPKAGGTTTVPLISGRGAGQYVDVAVVNNGNNDVACVVWFDQGENALKYSYITNPIGQWNALKGDATAKNWSTPITLFEGGEYCHIVADKNGHLHVAAYAGNGDVKYAYLDTYATTGENIKTCTVDSSGVVGEHLTLDVAVSANGNSIPYIGYYTAALKMPKYAYLVESSAFVQAPDGVDENELFTGKWEVTVVPSPSRLTTNREDKVNVGVWKNAGVLTDSKVGGSVINSQKYNKINGYSSENWSKTFGNGTSNGVLGYQISTSTGSCLETAQMR